MKPVRLLAAHALTLAMFHAVSLVAQSPVPCAFRTLEGWSAAQTRWVGDCQQGRAEGLGILKEMNGTRVVRAFYGRLKQGEPLLGVVETEDGQSFGGTFRKGKLLAPVTPAPGSPVTPETIQADRNLLIRAYDEAARAAQHLAQRYRNEGNEASAEYYETVAQHLAEQID